MAEIKTLAVIGAGPAGRGIARRAALAGYRTILVDILPANLRRAQDEMRERVEQGRDPDLPSVDVNAALHRLELATSLADAAREADLVIECVPDEMESKLEIFTLLDKICRPQTILASTTTTLSISDIASVTFRSAKIVGMSFDLHDSIQEVEILRTATTGDETVAAALQVGKRMGLKAIVE